MTAKDPMRNPEEYAVMLLSPLAGDPVSASRVDLARAMAEGRRRRRLRWYSGGAAIAALTVTAVAGGPLALAAIDRPAPTPTLTVPPTLASSAATATAAAVPDATIAPPAAISTCVPVRLPTDGIDKALVTGGDPSGRYLAGRLYLDGSGEYPVVIWKDGKIAERIKLPGGDQQLGDINTTGTAVGFSYDDAGQHAYLYRNGEVIRLAGAGSGALSINDAETIVGHVAADGMELPARWSSPTAKPVRLPVPAGVTRGEAIEIDEDGTILGSLESGTDNYSGYLWRPDGTGTAIPVPSSGGVKADYFRAESLRNGWVVGHAGFGGDDQKIHDFRYRIDTGTFEQLPDSAGYRMRVNAAGWVLREPKLLTITRDAGVLSLPSIKELPKGADYQLVSLSDDGRVAAGHGWFDTVENKAVMWRCR